MHEHLLMDDAGSLWLPLSGNLENSLRAQQYAEKLGTEIRIFPLIDEESESEMEYVCYRLPSDWEEVKRLIALRRIHRLIAGIASHQIAYHLLVRAEIGSVYIEDYWDIAVRNKDSNLARWSHGFHNACLDMQSRIIVAAKALEERLKLFLLPMLPATSKEFWEMIQAMVPEQSQDKLQLLMESFGESLKPHLSSSRQLYTTELIVIEDNPNNKTFRRFFT